MLETGVAPSPQHRVLRVSLPELNKGWEAQLNGFEDRGFLSVTAKGPDAVQA